MSFKTGVSVINRQSGEAMNAGSEHDPAYCTNDFLERHIWTPNSIQEDRKRCVFVCIGGMWHSPELYEPLGTALAERGHTSIAVGERGHGPHSVTNKPIETFTIEDYTDDIRIHLERILPKLTEQERLVLVAHSMGRQKVEPHLDELREQIEGTIFIGPATGGGARSVTLWNAIKNPWRFYKSLKPGNSNMLVDTAERVARVFFGAEANEEHVQFVVNRLGEESSAAFRQLLKADLWGISRPKNIQGMPVLILNGTEDPTASKKGQQRLAEALKTSGGNVMTSTIEDTGHYPWVEKPKDTAARIDRWAEFTNITIP